MVKVKSPINKENTLTEFLKCKDYTVSNEIFSLLKDEKSEFLITNPQPKLEDLGNYYKSEKYISHTDSSKSLFDKVYQIAKNYAIGKKIKLINPYRSQNLETKILDIGCGTGDFLLACKNKNWHIVGVEPNQKAVNNLKLKIQDLKLFKDIEELEKENQFDVITMWHVLEHVPNLENYILSLKKLLKPNGRLIIAVPNYKSFDAKHYKEFWAAYDVPRHLWHFSQKSIKDLFKKENMLVEKTLPMKLDSFYVSLLSEKYKTGKSNPIKAFYIGLLSNIKAKQSKEYSSLIYIIKNN